MLVHNNSEKYGHTYAKNAYHPCPRPLEIIIVPTNKSGKHKWQIDLYWSIVLTSVII